MKYFRHNKQPISEKKPIAAKPPTKYQMPHVSYVPFVTNDFGEDEASHDRHLKILSLEWKKSKPNKHFIGELMKQTFAVRRQRILTSQVSTEILLKDYSPRQQYNQVCVHTRYVYYNKMFYVLTCTCPA